VKRVIKISILVLVGLTSIYVIGQILKKSNDRMYPVTDILTRPPYPFRTSEAEQLSIKAFDLKKANKCDEAVSVYRQAIEIESDNPRLFFDLADCYSKINELELAVLTLDNAILLDSSYEGLFNNRGLYYYKLKDNQKAIKDFTKAIELDSSIWWFYANIALVYYSDDKTLEACEAFQKAKQLGLKLDDLDDQFDLEKLEEICD